MKGLFQCPRIFSGETLEISPMQGGFRPRFDVTLVNVNIHFLETDISD